MNSTNIQKTKESPENKIVFFCLARGYSIGKKHKYLKLVLRNIFLNKYSKFYKNCANLIFHEGNITFFDQFVIRLSSLNFKIRFIDISELFVVPNSLIWTGKSEYGLGYSLMCRFNYFQIWKLLQDFDTAIRIDDDVLVVSLGNIETDATYVCSKLYKESHIETNTSFYQYLEKRNLESLYDHKFPPNCLYITQVKFWNKQKVNTFLDEISNSPYCLEHRWGDTVVMGVALKKFVKVNSITLDHKISYIHLSHNLFVSDGVEVQIPADRIARYFSICKHYFGSMYF
jgi:hypothetical protein